MIGLPDSMNCVRCGETVLQPVLDYVLRSDGVYHYACWQSMKEPTDDRAQ